MDFSTKFSSLVPVVANEVTFYLVDARWFAAEFANCFRANHAITEENNRQACLRYLRVADRDYRLGPAPLQRRRVMAWLLSAGGFALGWFSVRPLVEGQPAWLRWAFDLILALILVTTALQGLWLGWRWLWPQTHVVISRRALEEGLPGLAASLEKRYDMTFLRGVYDDLAVAAKKRPLRERP
jgi:hypothetical protein